MPTLPAATWPDSGGCRRPLRGGVRTGAASHCSAPPRDAHGNEPWRRSQKSAGKTTVSAAVVVFSPALGGHDLLVARRRFHCSAGRRVTFPPPLALTGSPPATASARLLSAQPPGKVHAASQENVTRLHCALARSRGGCCDRALPFTKGCPPLGVREGADEHNQSSHRTFRKHPLCARSRELRA